MPLRQGRGQGAHDVAELVLSHVLDAQPTQLLGEETEQLELLRGGGERLGVLVGLGIDPRVAQEPLEDVTLDIGIEVHQRIDEKPFAWRI